MKSKKHTYKTIIFKTQAKYHAITKSTHQFSIRKGGKNMTRFQLKFTLETPEIPIDVDCVIVSFLKAGVQRVSPEWFDQLYNKKKSIIKMYSWSCYYPGAKFTKDKILLDENYFSVTFSDPDMKELLQFYNAFRLMLREPYPMNHNSMTLKEIRIQELPDIMDSEVIVKLKSSLIARRHNSEDNKDHYYTWEDSEFSEVIRENVKFFLEKQGLPLSMENFSVTPVKAKKIVARVWRRPIDATIGILKLTGSPELLNFLYASALGSRRSEGHGLWDIIW